jgi:hypothetical protein
MKRRGRKHQQLLDNLKEKSGYPKLKEEKALWNTCFGRGHEVVERKTT